jgi:hypothetical protein
MGLHEQLRQLLHGGDDVKAMPLPGPIGLGFPLLLKRGRMGGPRHSFEKEMTPQASSSSCNSIGISRSPTILSTVHQEASRNQQPNTPRRRSQHLQAREATIGTSFIRTTPGRPFNHSPVLVGKLHKRDYATSVLQKPSHPRPLVLH